jgi:hypothetical protein
MKFEKAIAWLSRTDGVSRKVAERKLCDLAGDGKLFLKWDDQTPDSVFDRPPQDASFWQQPRIRGSKVFDPYSQRERTLLLLPFAVQQIWPPAPPPPARRSGPKGGRPSDYEEKIKQKLSGVELTSLTDAIRHTRETWSANDGRRPSDKTISRLVAKIWATKTDKTKGGV